MLYNPDLEKKTFNFFFSPECIHLRLHPDEARYISQNCCDRGDTDKMNNFDKIEVNMRQFSTNYQDNVYAPESVVSAFTFHMSKPSIKKTLKSTDYKMLQALSQRTEFLPGNKIAEIRGRRLRGQPE